MKLLFSIFIICCLSACAGPKVTALDVEIAQYQASAQKECYKQMAKARPQFEDARDYALIVMAEALSGKQDKCVQTNVYDARSSIAASQNSAAKGITNSVANLAIAGAAIWGATEIATEGIKSAGDKTSVNTTGDVDYAPVRTSSTTSSKQYTAGNGASSSASAPVSTDTSNKPVTTITIPTE